MVGKINSRKEKERTSSRRRHILTKLPPQVNSKTNPNPQVTTGTVILLLSSFGAFLCLVGLSKPMKRGERSDYAKKYWYVMTVG